MRITSSYGSTEWSPQSVWSLTASTFVLYRLFWKEFLLASGSVIAAIWFSFGVSSFLGHDLRDVGSGQVGTVGFYIGVFGVYYAVVLLTIIAGEAGDNGSVSLWIAYRKSILGVATSIAVLASIALAMVVVLIIPLIGIVAALYLFVRLSVAFEIATLGQFTPLVALRRAWALTKSRFWIVLLEAILLHGALLAVTGLLAVLPNLFTLTALAVLALPAFAIFRVLGYLDLLDRERLEARTREPYGVA